MSTERDDLELQMQWLDLKEAYVAAKAVDRDSDECKAAKAAMSEFRAKWRGVRDAFTDITDGDAWAAPATAAMTAQVQEG